MQQLSAGSDGRLAEEIIKQQTQTTDVSVTRLHSRLWVHWPSVTTITDRLQTTNRHVQPKPSATPQRRHLSVCSQPLKTSLFRRSTQLTSYIFTFIGEVLETD